MSILLQAEMTSIQWALLSAMMIAALVAARALGIFRPDNMDSTRLERFARFQPLAIVFLIGFAVFFLSQAGYGVYLHLARTPVGEPFDMNRLTASDWAIMASVPSLLALLAMLICQRVITGDGLVDLGLRGDQLLGGIFTSLIGIALTLPLVFWFSAAVEWFYQRIGYEHPNEHDLLRVLRQARGWIKLLMLLAITVLAPLSEEILFRGYLQTALRRLLAPQTSAAAGAWGAIAASSLVFAVIHPIWSAPPIFLLSLALGYAYERTGNLWTAIFMHSLFNAASTALFWLMSS